MYLENSRISIDRALLVASTLAVALLGGCTSTTGPAGPVGPTGPGGERGPTGAQGRQGDPGPGVSVSVVPQGEVCTNGGVLVGDAPVCNGADGAGVQLTALPSGTEACPSGGAWLTSATGAMAVCNGLSGPKGDKGDPGPKGDIGAPGETCTITTLPRGNATCPAGGAIIADALGTTSTVCSAPAVRYVRIHPGSEHMPPSVHLYSFVNSFQDMWNTTTAVTVGPRGAWVHATGIVIARSATTGTGYGCTIAFAVDGNSQQVEQASLGSGTSRLTAEYTTIPVQASFELPPGAHSVSMQLWTLGGGAVEVADGKVEALLIVEEK